MLSPIKANRWLLLSLLIPLYFGSITLDYALPSTIVQDDARQHVVWLQQFFDPSLFPQDAIADYFKSVAPPGYKFLYWSCAKFGISALVLAKWIPIFLGVITTIYFYRFCLNLFPIPVAAWFSTVILNEMMWMKDDLCSATPRAFTFPIFAAFLYYLTRSKTGSEVDGVAIPEKRSHWDSNLPILATIALQGLFFPQLILVELAILSVRLFEWKEIQISRFNLRLCHLTKYQNALKLWLLGLIVAALVVIPFTLSMGEVGQTFSAAQMQLMPEFSAKGRMKYYGIPFLSIGVSGLTELKIPWYPVIALGGILLPIFPLRWRSILKALHPEGKILVQMLVAALAVYLVAFFTYPKLYFPNRYTYYVLRFLLSVTAGLVLYSCLVALSHRLKAPATTVLKTVLKKTGIAIATTLLFFSITLPFIPNLFLQFHIWTLSQYPALYQYLAQQPKDIRIASLALAANNIPAFSQRSIWVSDEFALPFHQKYYNQLQERAIATLILQYSPDLSQVKQTIQTHDINYLLLENESFSPAYLSNKNWLFYSSFQPVVTWAIDQLQQGKTPAIAQYFTPCTSLTEKNIRLLNTQCILRIPN